MWRNHTLIEELDTVAAAGEVSLGSSDPPFLMRWHGTEEITGLWGRARGPALLVGLEIRHTLIFFPYLKIFLATTHVPLDTLWVRFAISQPSANTWNLGSSYQKPRAWLPILCESLLGAPGGPHPPLKAPILLPAGNSCPPRWKMFQFSEEQDLMPPKPTLLSPTTGLGCSLGYCQVHLSST